MPTVKLAPLVNNVMFSSTDGALAASYKLFFYVANSSTKQDTYTSHTGSVANSNPITLSAYGKSATEIWLPDGLSFKICLAGPLDTDPPTSAVTLGDYVTGINDTGVDASVDQWIASGLTPTYISATQFTVTGDQTSLLHVGRRLKTVNTGGTAYSTITVSAYASVTTITVVNDSTTLDAGLSAVNYSLLSSTNSAIPKTPLPDGSTATTQAYSDSSTKLATTAFANLQKHAAVQDFRLTLTTAVPVTTADVTGATTIYCTPYKGNKIGLYNGTTWDLVSSAEFSLALGTLTANIGYDVFCYNNSGVATLEFLAWSSATARATALVMQDGILCKTGQLTRRYLGSFYTTNTTTTTDSVENRYLFNYYHRVKKSLYRVDANAGWAYTLATWRQARANANNQVDLFVGVVEAPIAITATAACQNATGATGQSTGIGLNSTSAPTGVTASQSAPSTTYATSMTASNNIFPILGKNYFAWLEYSVATGTSNWVGTSGGVVSGITGSLEC